jgi:hypothetical protein
MNRIFKKRIKLQLSSQLDNVTTLPTSETVLSFPIEKSVEEIEQLERDWKDRQMYIQDDWGFYK